MSRLLRLYFYFCIDTTESGKLPNKSDRRFDPTDLPVKMSRPEVGALLGISISVSCHTFPTGGDPALVSEAHRRGTATMHHSSFSRRAKAMM